MDKVRQWEEKYLAELNSAHKDTMDELHKGLLTDAIEDVLKKTAAQVSADMA